MKEEYGQGCSVGEKVPEIRMELESLEQAVSILGAIVENFEKEFDLVLSSARPSVEAEPVPMRETELGRRLSKIRSQVNDISASIRDVFERNEL